MLKIHDLAKSYGGRPLFSGLSLTLTPGERLGLVGRNGSGKTTLLRLILGEEQPDSGSVELPRNYRVGHLSQFIRFEGATVLEEACRGLPVQEGGWVETHRAEAFLMGLGFEIADFDRPPAQLSGGFQIRLELAKLLLSAPNLLLLDEPTNYLDILSVRWLERLLASWDGEIILITHDQDFMNAVTTHTMVIHRNAVRRVQGPTWKLWELIAEEEAIREKTRLNDEKARRQAELFIERFRAKATRASSVQSRIKMLARRDRIDELTQIADLDFRFTGASFTGNHLLEVSNLAFRYPGQQRDLVAGLTIDVRKEDRIAVIGRNGRGKTTLVNLLAGLLEPTRGAIKRHVNLRLAHFGQSTIDKLDPKRTVAEEIYAVHPDGDRKAVRSICGAMLFPDEDALKRIAVLSGGERARVQLGRLLVTPANLLLLDEPTNHLDMDSIDALIEAAAVFQGAVIIVTHNERVLRGIANRLVVFDAGETRVFEGTYDDFLERWGWRDEEKNGGGATGRAAPRAGGELAAAPINRKDERRQRAERTALRSKVLKPLAERVASLEREIIGLEADGKRIHDELCAASTSGDGAAITRLSQESHRVKRSIDERFAELERVTAEHDAKARELEE